MKKPITNTCSISGNKFSISFLEQELCRKFNVPLPEIDRFERMRRLAAFSNYTTFFHGTCAKSSDKILQIYRPDVPFPVYANHIWWSDVWDAAQYGRAYNFRLSFFEQFLALRNVVPQPALTQEYSSLENCEYVNAAGFCKNCYLIFNAYYDEDCLYCFRVWHSTDCIDCSVIKGCELCYDCYFLEDCYDIRHSFNSKNCHESAFLWNCIGCKNCFGCVNLRQKEYCYYNEQLSPIAYRERLADFQSDSSHSVEAEKKRFSQFVIEQPQPAIRGVEFGDSSGDFLSHCTNAEHCFYSIDLEDCVNCLAITKSKDCLDQYSFGHDCELVYNSCRIGYNCSNIKCSVLVFLGSSDCEYCLLCRACTECFGCIGLRHKEYCILNRQYSKADYFQLKERIIGQMKDPSMNDGRAVYGDFFPVHFSLYPYNDSDAQILFPLSREEARRKGYWWAEQSAQTGGIEQKSATLPDRTSDASDSLLSETYTCESSGQPYRITARELRAYRARNLPLPRQHWRMRMLEREELANPLQIYSRNCARTGKPIMTTFPPQSPWKVWDSKEYSQEFSG